MKMMKLLDLHKKFLAVLLLAFMGLGMAACSSTEEEPPPESSGCGDPDACPENDLQCREEALQDCPI